MLHKLPVRAAFPLPFVSCARRSQSSCATRSGRACSLPQESSPPHGRLLFVAFAEIGAQRRFYFANKVPL